MTYEEKQLLIKVLCAELQYGLLIDTPRGTFELDAISGDLISLKDKEGRLSDLLQYTDGKYWFPIVTGNYKPYLRPLSSMTGEEGKEYIMLLANTQESSRYIPDEKPMVEFVDWLNEHHLDYHNLIEKGLALEAPQDMYNH